MAARKVQLHLVPGGRGSTVTVDGEQLRGVRGVTLAASVRKVPLLTVDLLVREAVDVEAEAVVIVPEKTAALLVKLGWTPPGQLDAVVQDALDDAEYDRTHSPGEDD